VSDDEERREKRESREILEAAERGKFVVVVRRPYPDSRCWLSLAAALRGVSRLLDQ
jgi:hypothetical protein